jgi:hypothetical protein
MGYTYIPQVQEGYVLSDILMGQSDGQTNVASDVYKLGKSILRLAEIYPKSQLRIKFDMFVTGSTGYGKIYFNGSPIGTERSTNLLTWTTYSEDISFTNIKALDTIELWGYNTGYIGFGNVVGFRNFRIYANDVHFVEV